MACSLIGSWHQTVLPEAMLAHRQHINGLMQACSNSSALAMELLQFCTKPSIWSYGTLCIVSEHTTWISEMKIMELCKFIFQSDSYFSFRSMTQCCFDSLSPEKWGSIFTSVCFKLILLTDILLTSSETGLIRVPKNSIDDKSTMVQELSSLMPYCISRPQWVKYHCVITRSTAGLT